MPVRSFALLPFALVAACRAGTSSPIPEAQADPAHASTGVAVVELFTSEGCSSCPPADAVLERVTAEARAAGRPIVSLAFHVDYWDSLGWPDRFSSPDFTERQNLYAHTFEDSGMYTPEMVVGGVEHFVGSDLAHARTSLSRTATPQIALALRVSKIAPNTFSVHYDATGPLPEQATVLVAVVQREATVRIGGGENGGRTLHHTSIVRAMSTASLKASGDVTVRAPWAPIPDEADVAVLIQRGSGPSALAVLGAAATAIR